METLQGLRAELEAAPLLPVPVWKDRRHPDTKNLHPGHCGTCVQCSSLAMHPSRDVPGMRQATRVLSPASCLLQSLGVKSQAQLVCLRPGAIKRVGHEDTLEMKFKGKMEPALGEAGKGQTLHLFSWVKI